jgi:hypothetical protein
MLDAIPACRVDGVAAELLSRRFLRLQYRCPTVHLTFHEPLQGLGRAVRVIWNLGAEINQPLPRWPIIERLSQSTRQLGLNGLR